MSHFIELDGQNIPIDLKWHARAKRLILKLDPKGNGVIVTLPNGVPARDGIDMAKKHKVWIANQLFKHPTPVPFKDGATLTFKGEPHLLKHVPEARGTVWCETNVIYVAGQADFFERRLTDWLKKQAKLQITSEAHEFADQLGKTVKRISVRDTVSRWGSCSSKGYLNFNWRLILAPPFVLTYVVAHEVAHLRHMDHSPAFWATVDSLGVDVKAGRHWLKKNGTFLQRNGR
ncbi:SprT family zinc-dependent metalloprotease [Terasakiella sp. A23]|uniref:M48 family metallopeptidase n=1 Tax=Terasakiella sp. FCG-A23 TaxID=3080561 RepID=UPI0029546380|nr:SprT family zinc-dependent metalloprotease [Terasakiella sp. A23]MDV7337995.1 SprT family zinc-dependent metalloprotease [Terasakiella sp. A23]